MGAEAALRQAALDPGATAAEGLHWATIRRALRAEEPPRSMRRAGPSKLDPFRDEIQRMLREDPRLPTIRGLELVGELGFDGGKTPVYDYVADLRPLYGPRPRTFQRKVYRRGELLQFDFWQPSPEVPVSYGQTRSGPGLSPRCGFSRAGAGALGCSKETPDSLAGLLQCIERLWARPRRC